MTETVQTLFGVGGGLITALFLGSVWQWARTRPTLTGTVKTGSDLRMVGFIFFVTAAWNLCGVFGIGNYILRHELASRFSVTIGSTINTASTVMILLALGWGFTFFGQRISRIAQVAQPGLNEVAQMAATD